ALALMGVVALALAACDSGSTSAPPATTVPATTVPAVTAPPAGGANDLTPTQPAGGVNDLTPTQPAGAAGGSAEVKVDLKEWAVDLNPKELSAGKVKFDVSNTGQFGHDLVIQDSAGADLGRTPVFKSADGTQTLEV